MVAALRPRRALGALPTRKPGASACALPALLALGLGALLRHRRSTTTTSAFADPRASGNIGGFQGGIDLLRGSLIAGHYERAGLYGASGDAERERRWPGHQSGGDRLYPQPHRIR